MNFRILILCPFVLVLLVTGCALREAAVTVSIADFHSPAALKLPLELTPSPESGWERQEGQWALAGSKPGTLDLEVWWEGNRPPRG